MENAPNKPSKFDMFSQIRETFSKKRLRTHQIAEITAVIVLLPSLCYCCYCTTAVVVLLLLLCYCCNYKVKCRVSTHTLQITTTLTHSRLRGCKVARLQSCKFKIKKVSGVRKLFQKWKLQGCKVAKLQKVLYTRLIFLPRVPMISLYVPCIIIIREEDP